MSDQELERIKCLLLSETITEGHSIGLWNINERTRNKFGAGYGLKIESQLGVGTKVTVLLPAIKNITEVSGYLEGQTSNHL